jgi:hypothetical protein
MRFRSFVALAILFAALAGCGESDAATLAGQLKYTRDGGLRGVGERLTIQRDGKASVGGGKLGNRRFKLTKAELDNVARLVKKADIANAKVGIGDGADVFSYSLAYRGDTLAFNDINAPDEVVGLVGALNRLVKKYGGGSG